MGKTLRYGEFSFPTPNTRPTSGSYRSTKGISKSAYDQPHGMKYTKGGKVKMQKKVGKVMSEFKEGSLHSGKDGPVVKNPKQAIAIALSEGRKP